MLDRLVADASAVLGADLVGVHLVGSFALGDADEHSDDATPSSTGGRCGTTASPWPGLRPR